MMVGVPRESFPGERRVALVPAVPPTLAKAKCEVLVEAGAGDAAFYADAAYVEKGARIAASRAEVFAAGDAGFAVVGHGANDKAGRADLPLLRRDQVLIAFLRPLGSPESVKEIAATGATAFAVELIPRITRAQSMDALSSMATVAGYKAVLLAAATLPRMFPMLMTAAGTVTPAKVLIIGAGVAGLQAIATARKLGAVVSAYDVRPAAKEHVLSLGARFVELPLEVADAEDAGGYAKAQDETFYRRRQPGGDRPLPRQPAVRPEPHRVFPAPGEGRQDRAEPGGRDHAGDPADAGGRGGSPACPRRPGRRMMEVLAIALTVFVLAMFVGFEVITKVPPTLHTPLTSGSNAISGITLVGAILSAGLQLTTLTTLLGFLAVVFATINVVGGFLVTHRMLRMFKKK